MSAQLQNWISNGCTTSCPAAKEFDNVLAYYADASTVEDKAFARNLHDALPEHLRPDRAPVRGFGGYGMFIDNNEQKELDQES